MLKRGHENNEKAVKIKSGVVAAGLIIIIAFWGSIEIRQLTDKEEHTEAGDMIEIEGINPQTAYAGFTYRTS